MKKPVRFVRFHVSCDEFSTGSGARHLRLLSRAIARTRDLPKPAYRAKQDDKGNWIVPSLPREWR